MKIIDEEKVKNAANEYAESLNTDDMYHVSKKQFEEYAYCDFKKGVQFAETELSNLAIEFAQWIATEQCAYAPIGDDRDEWVDLSVSGIIVIINSTELFEKFIEQRKNL